MKEKALTCKKTLGVVESASWAGGIRQAALSAASGMGEQIQSLAEK